MSTNGLHRVTLLPANVTFDCLRGEPILTAALRQGLGLPYGCRKGNCSTCKAQVLAGDVDFEGESTYGLSTYERECGFTLLCSAYALSDVVLEIEALDATEARQPPPVSELTGTVTSVERLTHDIRALHLELERGLSFRAGQFAEVNAPGTDLWRSYSMANPPSRADRLELLIKLIPGGVFSSCVDTLEPGTGIAVRGPHGAFWLRDHDRPIVMIGGGAGMAPLWGMLQDLAEKSDQREITFFYGARTPRDLFFVDQLKQLEKELRFKFVPAFSEASPAEADGHECGLITEVAERLLGSELAEHDAYLCGPPPMIDAALRILKEHGLEEWRSIFYDKFTES